MTDEQERIQEVIRLLEKAYPDAPPTYLDHTSPFEMMIATILSAHTTDKCVNQVTRTLFATYPSPETMMKAPIKRISDIIRPCGTYNRKSVFVKNASRDLVGRFGGQVPKTMDELTSLPGISRKTANVILSVAFGINEGIVVDTHIGRVTQRLAFSKQNTPEKIEQELMRKIPREKWYEYARLIGAHGRLTCRAKKPMCSTCAVRHLCPSADMFE
ncbi:MAG: endonuclease III [Candidatus Thorarchaeota archaeon]|nr:MAG: endonuclease III [Candidatus Thorarchaeota archaeon]